jgi:endonuclease-3
LKGSYTLLLELKEDLKIEIGSLGFFELEQGFYAYNGSAFGPGGFKRVDRHKGKSVEGGDAYWHIDYLLVREEVEIVRVFKSEGSDLECSLSEEMKDIFESISGFGCSDCGCDSHLFYSSGEVLESFLDSFYG